LPTHPRSVVLRSAACRLLLSKAMYSAETWITGLGCEPSWT
jgi:hypothetical protein